MGLIPEDVIAQVLDRSDIVEVVSSYLPLKGAGRNFKACCPFHHEKTPSFMVNPAKQIFHCFGCGIGGNVISFVMKQEHMEFPEAVRSLANKVGVEVPTQQQSGPSSKIRDNIRRVNTLSAQYFHNNLLSDKTKETQAARKYLQERSVSREIVERFQLGFALESWDGLLNFLRSQEVSLNLMERAGLVSPQKRGEGFYDLFRNRIVFPIHDSQGRCVAFGARTMDPENPAKYINSPETPLYTKGRHLYGFHLAKDEAAKCDEIIVVEGYMDFVMPFQAGVKNIVASLGTALTIDQIRLIRRYTKNVCMLFDADQAGEAAMIRSLDLLIEEGMTVKIATLNKDDDPDSFIRQYGVESFRERISQARSFFDFKLDFYMARFGKETAQSKAQVAEQMLLSIAKFGNAIVRSEYLKRLATVLNVSQAALGTEFKKTGEMKRSAQRTETATQNCTSTCGGTNDPAAFAGGTGFCSPDQKRGRTFGFSECPCPGCRG